MSSARNPLDDLRAAHEQAWFNQHEAELIEKLRQKLKLERATLDIEAAGLHDAELAGQLAGLGIDRDTLPVLHLVPLVQVAWASGRVEPAERDLVVAAAHQAGVREGSPAWTALQGMLAAPPDRRLLQAGLAFLAAVAPESERRSLLEGARAVAAAAGGLFGIIGGVEAAERDALAEIAARLGQD
jgi:hypothetical protein